MDTPKTLLTFLYIFLGLSASAQITFEKRYDYEFAEAAHDIQQTSDGGYILAGRQGIGIGASKILLIKTDSMGNEEWHRLYNEYPQQEANAVRQTPDGGYIIAGQIFNIPNSNDPAAFYLLRTNSLGDTLWTKTYGGIGGDAAEDLEITDDGGFILVGDSRSFGNGDLDVYLVKTDSVGNLKWEKTYGGTEDDEGNAVSITNDGGFIITGYSRVQGLGAQAYLIRTNAQGDSLWTKTFGWDKAEFGWDVVETSDGDFLIAGQSAELNTILNYDKYLVKTNSEGDTLWTKLIPDTDTNGEIIYNIYITPDESFVTIGTDHRMNNTESGSSLVEIIKYNFEGHVIWRNEYGSSGSDISFGGILTLDGGFASVGLSDSNCGTCAYFIKTGPDGELITSLKPALIQDFDLRIYPNPASEQFAISFQLPKPGLLQIDLYDLHGHLILPINKADRTTQQYKEQVNVKDLTSGLYLLRFLDSDGAVLTKKIIIQ